MLHKVLLTLLVILVSHNYQKSPRRITEVEAIQGPLSISSSSNSSSSLPGLSERANVVNSRYLSAASTASLAAATVAAATSNNSPSISQNNNNNNNNNNINNNGANNSNNQLVDANRNFLLHQQQQQQQNQANIQQQQANQIPNLVQSQQQQFSSTPQSQQTASISLSSNSNLNSNNNQISPQFNNAQLPQTQNSATGTIGTPVMSTTYTYNPLINQFVPSELTTGSVLTTTPTGSGANNFLNTNNNNLQQQQNLLFGSSQAYNNNPYGLTLNNNPYTSGLVQQQHRLNNQFIQQVGSGSGYNQNQYGYNQQQQQQLQIPNQNLNQIINQQRLFNRRNGYSSGSVAPLPNRFTINNNYGQTIDDDGYFQQQQAAMNNNNNNNNDQSLLNEYGLGNSNYFVSSSSSSSSANNPYQTEFGHLITPQPSSVSSSIVLPTGSGAVGGSVGGNQQQTTTFNTAFTGAPSTASLFSELYKNDQCVAADGRRGTCYQASECIKKNGTPMGKCNSGPASVMNEFSGTSSYVCCLFDVTCGSFAAERFVYFRNPGYPNTFDQSQRMCRSRIGKLDKGICQFRLDLLRFDVAKPTNGNCSTDMFVVSGQNENYIIPKICGLNDGQHYYVGVDESGIITLHMMMMGYYRRNFEILITQIPCRSDYSAPAHCLQYYMGTHGTIKSFNYNDNDLIGDQQHSSSSSNYDLLPQAAGNNQQDIVNINNMNTPPYGLLFNGATNVANQQQQQQQLQQRQMFAGSRFGSQVVYANNYNNNNLDQFGGYPNDLDYTMCIRKESGFCSITYQLSRSEQGLQPFAVGHSIHNNNNNDSTLNSNTFGGWHPVSTECRDDYLLIGGVRLCSAGGSNNNFNQASSLFDSSIQFSQNGSILNSAGVFGQQLNSNNLLVQQQQQQLQNQYNSFMQQLARLQQQQQLLQQTGNSTIGTINNNNNQVNLANANNGGGASAASANNNLLVGQNAQQQAGGNSNLEQQQAAIIQQAMLIQQQLNHLTTAQQQNNRYQQQFDNGINQQQSDLQGSIITDTTSGPFILRFVSNLARNARGFHIDYKQNPCK